MQWTPHMDKTQANKHTKHAQWYIENHTQNIDTTQDEPHNKKQHNEITHKTSHKKTQDKHPITIKTHKRRTTQYMFGNHKRQATHKHAQSHHTRTI